jgi:hypothetical protein
MSRFSADEPWGDEGQFYVLGGHCDPREAFDQFNAAHLSLCGEPLTEYGFTPEDVVWGWATPPVYRTDGYDPDEYLHFHTRWHDETSMPVTILHAQGAPLMERPDLRSSDPFGPPEPPPEPPDPTLGGRILKRNGVAA